MLWAAKVTGRPVKWISTRSEAFLSDGQARDNVTDAELALDKDGNFLGLRVNIIANVGAFLQVGGQSFVGNLGTLAGVYKTPAVYADVTAVLTNTNPVRPYRGNGRPEAAYVIERMVDVAADELGIDPAVLRRKNSIPPDAMPFKTGLTFTYDSGDFAHVMDEALQMADAEGFEKRRAESRKHGKLRGFGFSNTIERAAGPGYEGAEIRFDRSGSITLFSGSNNQGQGHETAFKQIVCDRLGVDPKDITYVSGDTDTVFFGEGTGGSRSAATGGSAVAAAADKVITKAKQIAAHVLKVGVEDLKFEDGIFSSAKTNQTLTIGDVARAAANPAKSAEGHRGRPDRNVGLLSRTRRTSPTARMSARSRSTRRPARSRSCATAWWTTSAPSSIRSLVYGQITGGVAQGVGQILMEDIHFDPDSGQLATGSFMDYAMPRADNISALDIHSHPVPTPTNPLGVKGCGEAGCVGAMPAVANAIVDALSVYGVRHIEMPATPERVWRAIKGGRVAPAS